jgi:predicted transcriptional regulator
LSLGKRKELNRGC